MSAFGPDRDLTDEELDAALAQVDSELMEYVRTFSDPSDFLLFLQERTAVATQEQGFAGHGPACFTPSGLFLGLADLVDGPSEGPVDPATGSAGFLVIAQRHLARASVRDLAGARDLSAELAVVARSHDFDRARGLACELVRDLARISENAHAFDRDRALALELVREIDRDLASARSIARSLTSEPHAARDLDLARVRTSGIARDLADAHSLAEDLIRVLGEAAIDVSGADLSHLNLGAHEVEILIGAVWTGETRWPPGIASALTERSEEIRPGVYQVRDGNERHPLNLGTV